MRDAAGEVRTNSQTTFSNGPLHTDEQVLDDQLELIYNSSVRTQNVVWKIILILKTLTNRQTIATEVTYHSVPRICSLLYG